MTTGDERGTKGLMFKILVDTCVWLDLAKDARQRALLGVLEEFVREGRIALVRYCNSV